MNSWTSQLWEMEPSEEQVNAGLSTEFEETLNSKSTSSLVLQL